MGDKLSFGNGKGPLRFSQNEAPSKTSERKSFIPRPQPSTPRTPALSSLSYFNATCSKSRDVGGVSSIRRETRAITSKEFQVEAINKIKRYLSYHPDLSQITDTMVTERSISIKQFLEIINFMLKKIYGVKLNEKSYDLELPKALKKLKYPGTINRSILQTVNSPYSWQHIIALLSWMVDVMSIFSDEDMFQQLDYKESFEFSLSTLRMFNASSDPDWMENVFPVHLQEHKEKLANNMGIDFNIRTKRLAEKETVEKELKGIEAKRQISRKKLEEKNNELLALKKEEEKLKEKIKNFNEIRKAYEEDHLKKQHIIKKLETEKAILQDEVEQLKSVLDQQVISKAQVEEYEKELDIIKKGNIERDNYIKELKKIVFKDNCELDSSLNKMMKNITKYNILIDEKLGDVPRFERFKYPTTPNDKDFSDKVYEARKQLKEYISHLKEEYDNVQVVYEKKEAEVVKLQKSKQEYFSEFEMYQTKLNEFQLKIHEMETKMAKKLAEIERLKKKNQQMDVKQVELVEQKNKLIEVYEDNKIKASECINEMKELLKANERKREEYTEMIHEVFKEAFYVI